MANISVTNTNESGAGSLRQAILDVTAGDTITFEVSGTITPLSVMAIAKNVVIDGSNQNIIIQGGAANNTFTVSASTVKIKNLTFDGGAKTLVIAANGSTLIAESCTFKNVNSTADNGGALRIQGIATISNCRFENNKAGGGYGGGAICIYNAANVQIDKCSFIGNSATNNTTALGGAIVARGTVATACEVQISNSTFTNNTSALMGGAIGSSIQSSSSYTSNITAVNCTFVNNSAPAGGAGATYISVAGSANIKVINSLATNNTNGTAYDDFNNTIKAGGGGTTMTVLNSCIYFANTQSNATLPLTSNCTVATDASSIYRTTTANGGFFTVNSTNNGNHTIAELSTSSIAFNAGTGSVSGVTIPNEDQLGNPRSTTNPTIGAIEVKGSTVDVSTPNTSSITWYATNEAIIVSGLSHDTLAQFYSITGQHLYSQTVSNNNPILKNNLKGNVVIMKINNTAFKITL